MNGNTAGQGAWEPERSRTGSPGCKRRNLRVRSMVGVGGNEKGKQTRRGDYREPDARAGSPSRASTEGWAGAGSCPRSLHGASGKGGREWGQMCDPRPLVGMDQGMGCDPPSGCTEAGCVLGGDRELGRQLHHLNSQHAALVGKGGVRALPSARFIPSRGFGLLTHKAVGMLPGTQHFPVTRFPPTALGEWERDYYSQEMEAPSSVQKWSRSVEKHLVEEYSWLWLRFPSVVLTVSTTASHTALVSNSPVMPAGSIVSA